MKKQDGFALLFVLLVVAALELLALSTLALATHESVAVLAERRTVSARRAAEAALRRLARQWPRSDFERLAVGSTITATDSLGVLLTVQRHAWGLYEATGAAPAGPSYIRAALVLRTLDVPQALQEAEHAMHSFAVLADTLSCTLPVWPGAAAAVPFSNGYAIGGVRWEEAASIADTIVIGSATLAMSDSLGDPLLRVLYSPGDLSMAGLGSGVLLVDGDLYVLTGAEFHGIVVVRGTISAAQGARLTGSLWVQPPGIPILPSGALVFSRCWSARALLESPGARRVISANRGFIPAF